MTDQELINQLRQTGHRVTVPCPDGIKGCAVFHYRFETEPTCAAAADRIEQLREGNKGLAEAFAIVAVKREVAEGKLAKAYDMIARILAEAPEMAGSHCEQDDEWRMTLNAAKNLLDEMEKAK